MTVHDEIIGKRMMRARKERDTEIVEQFMQIAIQSLDPERWEALEEIVKQLKSNRNIN